MHIKKIIIVSILFSTLFTIACKPKSVAFDILPIGGDFTLVDQNNEPFTLSSLKGNIVLLFFGYTHCPDACPMTMGLLGKAYDELGDDAKSIKTVFITVDPERDNIENMQGYIEGFSETFPGFKPIGLIGTDDQIDEVIKLFAGMRMKRTGVSKSGYTMDHNTSVFVMDSKQQVRYLYKPADRLNKLVSILEAMLAAEEN
ncbi:MAG: SCO family protein [Leptospirales bacterium]